MGQYYFNLCDGQRDALIDEEGRQVELPDIFPLALREARAMISQDALRGRINLRQYIEVRDADGKLVCQLSFRDAVTISDID